MPFFPTSLCTKPWENSFKIRNPPRNLVNLIANTVEYSANWRPFHHISTLPFLKHDRLPGT